jgi:hypothetical protein
MNCIFKFEQKSIEQGVRTATYIAKSNGNKLVIDSGCGMTNVVMPALGLDAVIIQCYPNNEHNSVWILFPYKGTTETISLKDLPYILQQNLFENYCKFLGVKCEVDNDY